MRRHAARIFGYTLLGAVTTVAVAWACALGVQLQGSPGAGISCLLPSTDSATEIHLEAWQYERSGSVRYACFVVVEATTSPDPSPRRTQQEVREFVPSWSRHTLFDWVDEQKEWPPGEFVVQGVDARGWPFAALWCAYAWSPETEPDLWYWVPHGGGIQLGDGMMPTDEADWWPRAALPCLPIWLGAAGDTAIYGAAWWALLAAAARIRARIREHRGRCARCAYGRRGLDAARPCPECGAPSRSQRRSHPAVN